AAPRGTSSTRAESPRYRPRPPLPPHPPTRRRPTPPSLARRRRLRLPQEIAPITTRHAGAPTPPAPNSSPQSLRARRRRRLRPLAQRPTLEQRPPNPPRSTPDHRPRISIRFSRRSATTSRSVARAWPTASTRAHAFDSPKPTTRSANSANHMRRPLRPSRSAAIFHTLSTPTAPPAAPRSKSTSGAARPGRIAPDANAPIYQFLLRTPRNRRRRVAVSAARPAGARARPSRQRLLTVRHRRPRQEQGPEQTRPGLGQGELRLVQLRRRRQEQAASRRREYIADHRPLVRLRPRQSEAHCRRQRESGTASGARRRRAAARHDLPREDPCCRRRYRSHGAAGAADGSLRHRSPGRYHAHVHRSGRLGRRIVQGWRLSRRER